MTDQAIPADEVRKIIAFYRDGASELEGLILDALGDLLPTPPRPTLADMPPEEWVACQWMQCDVKDDAPAVLLRVGGMYAHLVDKAGMPFKANHADVTPRPDLPRMTWPGDTPTPAPALPEGWRLADHPKHGRVIVTNPTPDIDGHVYFVAPATGPIGNDWHFCTPAELMYLDTTPAPSPSTLTVGSEWDDADSLNRACEESGRDQIVVSDQDGYAFVWDKAAEWWEGSMPPQFIPLTILHTGKKADQ